MVYVDNYMSSPVIVASRTDSLAYVRNLMLRHRIGRIVVVDEHERPIGILTHADMARVLSSQAAKRPLDRISVEEAMTKNPIVVNRDDKIEHAARIMIEHGVGGLPVVNDNSRLIGIITKTDIIRFYIERRRADHRVREFMETSPPIASPMHSLSYVASLLESSQIRRVLVVDDNRLVGIIAPSDLSFYKLKAEAMTGKKYVRRFSILEKGRLGPVYSYLIPVAADIMTPDPITVSPEEKLSEAARIMLERNISSIPVVVDESPIGIVVKHNILKAVIAKD
ncbi:MAG: CBS domain-containing protein [Pyrodictiaceae archaeon]